MFFIAVFSPFIFSCKALAKKEQILFKNIFCDGQGPSDIKIFSLLLR
jgi:hypothetical protein